MLIKTNNSNGQKLNNGKLKIEIKQKIKIKNLIINER